MTDASPSLHNDVGNRHIEDHFNRKPFAQRLADTIARRSITESFVIGLYGAWGEGKTTVLDYMDEALSARPNVILVRFNPWLFSSDEALTRALITTIGTEVDLKLRDTAEGAQRIGQLVLSYGGKLLKTGGAIAGNSWVEKGGELAESLAGGLNPGEQTLEQLKTRIGNELLKANKRVVVLLDDIDRLTRQEIQQVFRLIKVAVDFPTVTYVLAFDPEMVAAAVAAQYGSGDPGDGQRFLEKIVQLPLHLPHLDRPSITEYTFDLLVQTLREVDVTLTPEQLQRLSEVLRDDIMAAVQTPRQAKRYANAVAFALPILRGETDPVDVLLVEALRVLYPQTFELVRGQPDLFLNPATTGRPLPQKEEQVKARLEELLREHGPHAVGIVRELFPDVNTVLTGMQLGRAGDDERKQGVFRARYFPRYFQYAIPGDDVSDAQIDAFMAAAVLSPEQADDLIRTVAPEKRAFKFMEGIRDVFPRSGRDTQRAVLLTLARNIPAFEQNESASRLSSPLSAALRTMVDAVEQSHADDAISLARQLLGLTPEPFALRLMGLLEAEGRTRAMSPSYYAAKGPLLGEMRECLVERLEGHGPQLADVLGRDYVRGLRRIARVRGREAAEANLVQHLEAGADAVERFLVDRSPANEQAFAPVLFDEGNYALLKEVIDPATLIGLLDRHFPPVPPQEDTLRQDPLRAWMDEEDVTRNPREAARQIAARIRQFHAAEQDQQEAGVHQEGHSPPAAPDAE